MRKVPGSALGNDPNRRMIYPFSDISGSEDALFGNTFRMFYDRSFRTSDILLQNLSDIILSCFFYT